MSGCAHFAFCPICDERDPAPSPACRLCDGDVPEGVEYCDRCETARTIAHRVIRPALRLIRAGGVELRWWDFVLTADIAAFDAYRIDRERAYRMPDVREGGDWRPERDTQRPPAMARVS